MALQSQCRIADEPKLTSGTGCAGAWLEGGPAESPMPQQVTASFGTRQEAEAAQARLVAAGVEPQRIRIEDPAAKEEAPATGLFDALTDFLAPGKAERPGGYLLTADVLPQQLEAATRALLPDGAAPATPSRELRDQVVEFVETEEELVIAKELFVYEEVVLRKHVEQRVQDITYVVRRMDADVERIGPPADQPGRNR